QGYTFDAALVNANGRFRAGEGGYLLTADGSASGSSGLPAARARRIAAAVPVISGDAAQERAIAAFLQSFSARASRISLTARNGDVDVALTGPVTLRAASGGEAVLTPRGRFALLGGRPGGFDIATRGGGLPDLRASVSSWSYRPGAIDARLAFKGSLNAPPADKAVVDAEGVLRVRGRRTTFTLTRCGTARAELIDFGEVDLTNASATVCPSGQPLVVANGGVWRLSGRFENGKAEIPIWQVAGADASGNFDVGGSGDMDTAAIRLAALRLSDTTEVARFNPVRASGGARLANGAWQGAFPVTTDDLDPVGSVGLSHHVASGRGEARIDATGMVFAKEGFQPVEVLPVAQIIRDAEGQADFIGVLTWGPEGVTSSGALSTAALNFQSPTGKVTGLNAAIQFTSLSPLITAPDQSLTIQRLDAITPLENIQARFDLVADAANIDQATATLADGQVQLEPLTVPLAADRTVKGVLNLSRIDIGKIVADTSLADRIKVDAIVDGRLPFEMGPDGIRFREGRLRAVQPGRISISRTVLSNVETGAADANPMDATQPAEEFNAVQDFAYQAMENLSFDVLEADVNSLAAGRLGVVFRIQGEHDPAVAEEARISIQEAVSGDAFNRRIPLPKGTPVNLTLDTSLNFDELLAAWRRGWMDAAEP
ncbi:MAG TPA: YdbH domain-containing protein, partial [Caulobacteraceae bacterium]|nr:YdbH domain-containing protein [Caulobacteraceae bacterium]